MVKLDYLPAIGIETHVQLKTKSKLFCGCSNDAVNAEPNTLACPICMGFPGALPMLNERAVELAIRIGQAVSGQVAASTKFDRKHYFYPDLPKGYQISQYDKPIISGGHVEVILDGKPSKIRLVRAHLEEDAGKLLHPENVGYSLLDLNRAGTPLVEIVSEPEIISPAQAKAYVQELYRILRYAEVSDVDLFQGNLRFDVNVSVRPRNVKKLGVRTEIKNLNSFRAVEAACQYEINRQVAELKKGNKIVQETRGWNEAKGVTTSQRSKEEAHDYRYFPEPDLPPLKINLAMVKRVTSAMPKLPKYYRAGFAKLGLSMDQTNVLLLSPMAAMTIERIRAKDVDGAKLIAKLFINATTKLVEAGLALEHNRPLPDSHLLKLARMVKAGSLSLTAAKTIFWQMLKSAQDPETIARTQKLLQVSEKAAIEKLVERVVEVNAKATADYKGGNLSSLQFLIGQVMKESKGQANPGLARELLKRKLG